MCLALVLVLCVWLVLRRASTSWFLCGLSSRCPRRGVLLCVCSACCAVHAALCVLRRVYCACCASLCCGAVVLSRCTECGVVSAVWCRCVVCAAQCAVVLQCVAQCAVVAGRGSCVVPRGLCGALPRGVVGTPCVWVPPAVVRPLPGGGMPGPVSVGGGGLWGWGVWCRPALVAGWVGFCRK